MFLGAVQNKALHGQVLGHNTYERCHLIKTITWPRFSSLQITLKSIRRWLQVAMGKKKKNSMDILQTVLHYYKKSAKKPVCKTG